MSSTNITHSIQTYLRGFSFSNTVEDMSKIVIRRILGGIIIKDFISSESHDTLEVEGEHVVST